MENFNYQDQLEYDSVHFMILLWKTTTAMQQIVVIQATSTSLKYEVSAPDQVKKKISV